MRLRNGLVLTLLLALVVPAAAASEDGPVTEDLGGSIRLAPPSKDGGLPEMYREIPRITARSLKPDSVVAPAAVKPGFTELPSLSGSEAGMVGFGFQPRGGSPVISPALQTERRIRSAIRKLG